MAQVGDDCYFFYYSSCSKGSNCPFRHVEAALGSEVMCTHWQAGNCTRPGCKYRHFEIKVDRRSTPCYWETQPSGCTKPHCVFKHFKQPRSVDTLPTIDEVPSRTSKSLIFKAGGDMEMSALHSSPHQDVDRASPKIEPVVVNPFEDDSDADSASGTPQKKAVAVRRTGPFPSKPVVPRTGTSPVKVAKKLPTATIRTVSKPSDLSTSKRKIKMLEDPDPDEQIGAGFSMSDSVLFEESKTRRNVVIDDGDSDAGKSFHDILKKSKSSTGLSVQTVPKTQTANVSVKKRLGRTETSSDQTVKVSVKDRLGGKAASAETSPVKSDVRSRLGVTSSKSILGLSLADLRAQKLQIKKQLEEDSDEQQEEEPVIKIKSLEEIRAEKAKKAQLETKQTEPAQEKRAWRKNTKPVPPPAKSTHKRKVITYTELFDEPEKESAPAIDPVPKVEVKSLADIKVERARKKPLTAKKERAIYMPPALKNSELTNAKDLGKAGAVKRTITPPPSLPVETKVAKMTPADDVNVKTFSEIMAEKRRKQQELKAKQEADKKTAETKSKVSITPIVFDVDKEDEKGPAKTTKLSQNGKETVTVVPLRNKTLNSKENVSVANIPEEQKCPSDSRLSEGHVLSDNNVCENVKGIVRTISREEIHSPTKRQASGSEKPGVVSPPKRRSSSQGSDLLMKKKSRQSLSITEDDDDFFFGTDLDDIEDGGKIDDGDLLQDIDELLA